MHLQNLVLAGGGPLTLRFIGCIEYLEHMCMMQYFTTFVGTSAGAMIAVMLVLGMRSVDMVRFIKDKFIKGKCHELDLAQVVDFAVTWGFDNGARIIAAVGDMISTVTGVADISFIELAKHTGKILVVCVSNLTRGKHEFLSLETTPDMSVLTAIRMSMSIPVVFTPVRHNDMLYVDGGLYNNFPIDYCIDQNKRRDTAHIDTLGLDISFATPDHPVSLSTVTEYFVSMMCSLISRSNMSTHDFYRSSSSGEEQHAECGPHGAKVLASDGALVVQFANANSSSSMFNFSVPDMCFDMSDQYIAESAAVGYAVMKHAARTVLLLPDDLQSPGV